MPRGVWNQEWLNQNSQRAYPLAEFATQKDRTGVLSLPEDFILALSFPAHAGNDVKPTKFYLQEIGVFSAGFSISIGYDGSSSATSDDDDSNRPTVGTTIFSRTTHTEYSSYALAGKDSFSDSVGQICIGDISTISNLAKGTYVFNPADGHLEVDTIDPMIRQVQGLVIVNSGQRSDTLYGDIELAAGSNVRLDVTQGDEDTNAKVVINAISSAGLTDDCVCEDDASSPGIRTINGIPPTTAGNFNIVGDECLVVSGITNGIVLNDKCSAPDCSCEELEAMAEEIQTLHTHSGRVQGVANKLESEVANLSSTMINLLADYASRKG